MEYMYKYRVFMPFWVLLRFADLEPELPNYVDMLNNEE